MKAKNENRRNIAQKDQISIKFTMMSRLKFHPVIFNKTQVYFLVILVGLGGSGLDPLGKKWNIRLKKSLKTKLKKDTKITQTP